MFKISVNVSQLKPCLLSIGFNLIVSDINMKTETKES